MPSVTGARLETAKRTKTSAVSAPAIQERSFMSLIQARARTSCPPAAALPLAIEPLAQLLAGLEEGDVLLAHGHGLAGARVAPQARAALLDREGAEAAQLDAVALREGRGDLVEDRGHDALDVPLVEMRVALGDAQDQLRLGHRLRPPSRPP